LKNFLKIFLKIFPQKQSPKHANATHVISFTLRFNEQIYKLICCGDIKNINISRALVFANEMIPYIYVFCPSMKLWIVNKAYGGLISCLHKALLLVVVGI
jgi:hypothetical protein